MFFRRFYILLFMMLSGMQYSLAAPICQDPTNSDPDGDGWGWENNASCMVNGDNNNGTPSCQLSSSDPDGDGWGWENNATCIVDSTSDNFPECIDSDGDGWGWDGQNSCIVPLSTSLLFTHDDYDYVPAVMIENGVKHIWWCGTPTPPNSQYTDPNNPGGDVIFYNKLDLTTNTWAHPVNDPMVVLRPSTNSSDWDSHLVCDPTVVKGNYVYDGTNYTYAMYYTGTDDDDTSQGMNDRKGRASGVGVAFSGNGTAWTKVPGAIIRDESLAANATIYGRGHQVAYNSNGGSITWLWVLHLENPQPNVHRWFLYRLTDGYSTVDNSSEIVPEFEVTRDGIRNGQMVQTDFAYSNGELYAATNRFNDITGIDIYKIDWADQENGSWTFVGSIEEAQTGRPFNRHPALLRNIYGNIPPGPLEVYFTAIEADPNDPTIGKVLTTWDLYKAEF